MRLSSHAATVRELTYIDEGQKMSLVYVSSVIYAFKKDRTVFDQVGEIATKNNKANHINGFLCGSKRYFIECLEGTKASLLKLMERIFSDKRHRKVQVILAKCVERYCFKDWTVHGYCLEQHNNNDFNQSLKEFMPFKPLRWQEGRIENFIGAMSQLSTPSEDKEQCITYRYNSDATIFLGMFLLPIMLLSLLVWLVFQFL